MGLVRGALRYIVTCSARLVERLFAADRAAARAQHVQAHPSHGGCEPSLEVLDIARIGAGETQPRLLHGIVGLAAGAEHAKSHRSKHRPHGLEARHSVFAHVLLSLVMRASGLRVVGHICRSGGVNPLTSAFATM